MIFPIWYNIFIKSGEFNEIFKRIINRIILIQSTAECTDPNNTVAPFVQSPNIVIVWAFERDFRNSKMRILVCFPVDPIQSASRGTYPKISFPVLHNRSHKAQSETIWVVIFVLIEYELVFFGNIFI